MKFDIYIVLGRAIDFADIIGVFDTEEKAMNCILNTPEELPYSYTIKIWSVEISG
jgi:hypothetical protein